MRGKKWAFSILAAILLFALTACGSDKENAKANNKDDSNAETITVKHDLGTTEIKGKPKKIVVLEFSFLDALANLNISPVGIADDGKPERIIPEIKDKVKDYTSVGSRKQPNVEVISSLQPDLIIIDSSRQSHKDIYKQLSTIAPTIGFQSSNQTYDQTLEQFKQIAHAVGEDQKGDEVLKKHNEKVANFQKELDESKFKDLVIAPAHATVDKMFLHSDISYVGTIFKKLGLPTALQDKDAQAFKETAGGPYYNVNLEQFLKINPDVLFLMTDGEKTIEKDWETEALWKETKVANNKQIYYFDRMTWARFRGLIPAEIIMDQTIDTLKKIEKK
ncbi:Fe(3+) dicitrate ABC transporter substrate-binding protein [Bacillus cereus]|uniref:ABC transporter substrate-binding protein n=1 Tax=Bacillus cereus TaxID=1396 RepID=UPI0025A21962|nr:Fe(3+) dicitrate ABC transporter substrate-binding protein [Bacillus cereus]MDM5234903.1 Fe(3+) dicitrate ABC transporter substrate-binding protein [Bacillus cereus]